MVKDLSSLKILLIQIRADHIASRHERDCVLEITGISAEQLDFVNIAVTPKIKPERYEGVDGVLICGSGSHSAVHDDPFTESLIEDIKRLVDQRVPILGSCWGHQFMARALGGEVIHDAERGEVGVCDIYATEPASADPMFMDCPNVYTALMGHHDRVNVLPPGATELGYSEKCRNQAFRLDGYPVYGTQFHTELLPERLIERLTMFRQYMPNDGEFEELKASIRATPYAAGLMKRFLEAVVLN